MYSVHCEISFKHAFQKILETYNMPSPNGNYSLVKIYDDHVQRRLNFAIKPFNIFHEDWPKQLFKYSYQNPDFDNIKILNVWSTGLKVL